MTLAPAPLAIASLVCIGLGSGPVQAASGGLSDIPGTTPQCAKAEDRIACLSDLADRSAARVRAALAKARSALKASVMIPEDERAAALASLERTQRAWQAYAKLRCREEVAVSFTGGTGRNAAVLTCLRIHDERRAAELADLAEMN